MLSLNTQGYSVLNFIFLESWYCETNGCVQVCLCIICNVCPFLPSYLCSLNSWQACQNIPPIKNELVGYLLTIHPLLSPRLNLYQLFLNPSLCCRIKLSLLYLLCFSTCQSRKKLSLIMFVLLLPFPWKALVGFQIVSVKLVFSLQRPERQSGWLIQCTKKGPLSSFVACLLNVKWWHSCTQEHRETLCMDLCVCACVAQPARQGSSEAVTVWSVRSITVQTIHATGTDLKGQPGRNTFFFAN